MHRAAEATLDARLAKTGPRVSSFVRVALALCACGVLGCEKRVADPQPVDPQESAGESPSAAGSATSASDVGGKPLGMGELGQAPSYSMQVHGAKSCVPPSWHRAKAGFARIGFDVEITGKSSTRIAANAFYARLSDQEGKGYRPVFGGCEPDLRHAPLGPGDSTRGFVTFEVPETAGRLTLRYQPQLSGPPEALEFDLGTSPAAAKP